MYDRAGFDVGCQVRVADFQTGVHHGHLHAGAGWTVYQRPPHVQVLTGHPAVGGEGHLAGIAKRPLMLEQGILCPWLGVSLETRAGDGDTVSVGEIYGGEVHRAASVVVNQIRVLFGDRQYHEREEVVAAGDQVVERNPDRVE